MSEEDAEIALLHQMQAGHGNGSWNAEEEAQLDDSSTEHNESVKRENVADDHVLRALSSSADLTGDGEYDPSSVTSQPAIALAESRSSSQASVRKPKTVGGFVADDSDDEEEDTQASGQATAALQVPAANSLNRTVSPSPLQNSITQEDLKSPVDQADLDGKSASISLPFNPSGVGADSVPAKIVPVTAASITSAQPKARLPHDTTGILEDRIKEDPRGDLDAWMSLINEHRGRSKFEEAKDVYERFLKTFPHAVSSSLAHSNIKLTLCRLKSGWHTLRWNSTTTTSLLLRVFSADL